MRKLRQRLIFEKNLGITTLSLWGSVASPEGGRHSKSSTLTIFVPHPGTENGTAVIIAPGGAYVGWANKTESVLSGGKR